MNCQEAQVSLSGYLEKSLDAIRMKSIESHLSTCPFCRAEVHGLEECIREVAELPALEPPTGFAQRVMAQAREIEIEPTGWRRMLAVLKTTMPIQAAAMVLIAVLAVLLYQKEPGPGNIAFTDSAPSPALQAEEALPLPSESRPPVPASPSPARETKQTNIAPSKPARERAPEPRPQSSAEGRAAQDESAAAESPALAKRERAIELPLQERIAPRRRPLIQAQEVSTGSESQTPRADALGIGAAIGALSRTPFRGAPYSAEGALSPLSEPMADLEFIVRRLSSRERLQKKEELRGETASKGAESDGAAGVQAEAMEQLPRAPRPVVEIRWFTVAPEHYEFFRKDLAAESNIESEKSAASKETDRATKAARELLIKVTILPADR